MAKPQPPKQQKPKEEEVPKELPFSEPEQLAVSESKEQVPSKFHKFSKGVK